MKVKVNLCSILSLNRFEEADVTLPAGATLRDLLTKVEVSVEEVSVAVVNGKSGSYNQELAEGDQVSLLPFISGG